MFWVSYRLTGVCDRAGRVWGGQLGRRRVTLWSTAVPLDWNGGSVTIWYIQNLNKHTNKSRRLLPIIPSWNCGSEASVKTNPHWLCAVLLLFQTQRLPPAPGSVLPHCVSVWGLVDSEESEASSAHKHRHNSVKSQKSCTSQWVFWFEDRVWSKKKVTPVVAWTKWGVF